MRKFPSFTNKLSLIGAAWSAFAAPAFASGGAEGKAGLPQFDVSFYPSQLFWFALSFGLLYVVMAKVALPRIQSTQSVRADKIKSALANAEEAHEAAKATSAAYEQTLRDARQKAQQTVRDMSDEAAKTAALRQYDQQERIAKKLADAEKTLKATRSEALGQVDAMAHDVAQQTFSHIVGAK